MAAASGAALSNRQGRDHLSLAQRTESRRHHVWPVLDWLGLAFLLMGLVDLALAWFPLGLGNPEWEFGTISATNFDEHGNLEITYSNSEKKKVGRLVLASFDSSGDLASIGDGLYVTQSGRSPKISAGMEFGLGRISGGKLELSNVELTDQFTTLIILQRGYQACSQMTSVANEMMQQLLAMQSGGK